MASVPFTFTGALNLPADDSLPADPIPFNLSAVFDQKANYELKLTGAGTKVVDLGTIDTPGVKYLAVKVDPGTGILPLTIQLNGVGSIELSAGGFIILASPAPVAGTTTLSITYTGPATVKVWALK